VVMDTILGSGLTATDHWKQAGSSWDTKFTRCMLPWRNRDLNMPGGRKANTDTTTPLKDAPWLCTTAAGNLRLP
jgi:hypothetical protein